MDRILTTIPAHFDGTAIRLDVPIALEPNARLLVTVLEPVDTPPDLVYQGTAALAPSFAAVWDNDEDAVYDAY